MIESTQKIEAAKQHIDWKRVTIQINNLLPQFDSITKKLQENGIYISNKFGSSAENPEIPKELIISFGENINIDHLRLIVNLLRPFGFDKIDFGAEDLHLGKIYIGSYIYRDRASGNIVNLNDHTIEKLMNAQTSIDEFIDYMKNNRIA